MDGIDRGVVLVVAAVGLVVVTMGASAALSPGLSSGTGQGQTLVGSQAWGASWHDDGRVYLLNGTEMAWHIDAADSYFEVQEDDGTVLAAFANQSVSDCGPYATPCARTGFHRLDPDTGTVISAFSFPVRGITNSEVHAVDRLPGGGVVFTDMDAERIAIARNGSVVWEWQASSLYTPPSDPTRTDWLHINDVEHVGDGQFLVSVRNANQLVVVERGEGVVEIINEDRSDANDDACPELAPGEDGDVRCGDPDVLNHQHNPQWLGDGAVLVADSHNDRVVELHRTNGTWRPTWATYEVANVPLDWPRDADRLPNGNTLITDTINGRLVEIDANGTTVWSMSTAQTPYEADRLPIGEPVGAPAHGTPDATVEGPDAGIPILTTLAFSAHAVAPILPYWFGEFHVLVVLVSVVLALAGVVELAWSRWQE